MKLSIIVLSSLFVVACGPKEPARTTDPKTAEPTADTAPPATTEAPAADASTAKTMAPLTPPPKAWAELDEDEKKAHMKDAVVPAMKDRFQAFDAAHFEKFTCATCHGPKGREVKFKMPNPDLPKLPSSEEAFMAYMAKATDEQKRMVDFMMKTVNPDMAALLGQKPYDPATHTGFSCMNCHTPQ